MPKFTNTAAVSRAALRDSLNRLKSIRKRCGKEDEDGDRRESSGDPFKDRTTAFLSDIKSCKELISERNEGARKNGQDRTTIEQSHDVNRALMQLEKDLKDIQTLVNDAERKLAKENAKGQKSKAAKIQLYEQQFRLRKEQYERCKDLLDGCRNMNHQRFGGGGKAGLTGAQEIKMGKSNQLREKLMGLSGRSGQYAVSDTRTSNVGPDGEIEMTGRDTLEENPETAEQMKVLAEQERKINAGLERVGKGVQRLHELATEIGAEIDTQNRVLDATDDKVSSQTKQLKQLNRRLKKLVKESKPMNIFINVACFMLLLALVGYFLYEFGVV